MPNVQIQRHFSPLDMDALTLAAAEAILARLVARAIAASRVTGAAEPANQRVSQ